MFIKIFILSVLFCFSSIFAQLQMIENVPDVRQSTEYSCGASALQSVLLYWGHEYMETELMELVGTTCESGTQPTDLVRGVEKLKLDIKIELQENMKLEDLEKLINQKIPVIICGQAWREGEDTKKEWKNIWSAGHFMVVIGYDNENIYLEDPWLLTQIAYIPKAEFMDRWHCYEGESPMDDTDRKFFQMGIIIKGKQPVIQSKLFRLE